MTDLSAALATRVAEQLVTDFLRGAPPGRCLRLDHLRDADCHVVREKAALAQASAAGRGSTAAAAAVAVLGTANSDDDTVICPERAIELRNRKSAALLLLVPSGVDTPAASSLENSFEAIDLVALFGKIARDTYHRLDRPLRELYDQVQQTVRPSAFTRSRQARVEYLLAVSAAANDPADGGGVANAQHTAGAQLHLVGLIPDHGGASFASRLEANATCVTALVKPARSQQDARERLRNCPLRQDDEHYQDIERFVVAVPRLSERTWLRDLAAPENRELTFDRWPLDLPADSDLVALHVEPFANPDGIIPVGTGLRAGPDGALPACSVRGGFVKITWKTEPAKPKDVARWRVEIIPSEAYYGEETDFDVELPGAQGKASARSHRLTVALDTEDAERVPAVVVVQIQALDRNNQVLRLRDGQPAHAVSQEFSLDDAQPAESTTVRRDSALSLPIARLRALQAGADAETETCEGWQEADLAYLQLRFGRGHATRIALSVALRELGQRVLAEPDSVGRYGAVVAAGQPFSASGAVLVDAERPGGAGKAFLTARREFFDAVRAQPGRGLIEVADVTDELATLASRYTAAYGRALRRDSSLSDTRALTTVDTLRLRIDLGRRDPVNALVVLPTHPLRVAWYLAYCSELEAWRRQLRAVSDKERAGEVDIDLLARLSPARVPFLLSDDDGNPYVFAQNLRLLHGLYLPVGEPDPATAISEVVNTLGLPNADVSVGEVPAARLADRIRLYRQTHHQPERLRILATNPGSGAFLAEVLRVVTADTGGDAATTAANAADDGALAPHLQVEAFGEGASETNPLSGLRELQQELAENRARRGRGFLDPALEILAAPLDAIDTARDAHLAILTDVSRPELVIGSPKATGGSVSFRGLINRPVTELGVDGGWVTGIDFPPARGSDSTPLTDIHRRFAEAVTSLFVAAADRTPAAGSPVRDGSAAQDGPAAQDEPRSAAIARVRMEVSGHTARVLDLAHERCDWVVVLDRFLGLDTFDDPAMRTTDLRRYILDYAPEFLDGLGHQMAITTAHRADVEKMFLRAMTELGFHRPGESISSIIDELLLVSGRLILAATGDDNRAKEAVALAAAVAYLRRLGDLENTVIVPVDAHPELFGSRARRQSQAQAQAGQRARRCDLLLVRFPTTRRVSIEAVEVKSRGMLGSEDLARDIAGQVAATIETVDRLFFTEPARIDRPLQRARLAALLRYYLRRSARRGLITEATEFGRIQEAVDRLETSGLTVGYQRSGYIVVLREDGTADIEVGGTRIRTITARDLGVDEDVDARRPAYVPPPRMVDPIIVSGDAGARSAGHGTSARADTVAESSAGPAVVRVPLGRTPPPEEDIVWEASTTGSPHLFILGIPGQGKSETTIRLLQGAAAEGLPTLVIDFHGQFGQDPRRPESLRVQDAVAGLPFSPFELAADAGRHAYKMNALSVSEIFAYVCGLGDIQRDVVYQALVAGYTAHGHGRLTPPTGIPTLEEIQRRIGELEKERGVANVLARCRPLLEYGLFTDDTGLNVQDMIKNGLVVDLRGFAEAEQAQVAAGAFLLRKVYKDMFSWGQTGKLRLAIVLDEAHRLAKDATLPKLMKEGRKFGIAIIVASQGIDDFHPDVLANAGTKIIYRINYPQSRKAAGFLRTRTGRELAEDIEQLPVGSAYVQTPDMADARRTRMLRPDSQ